LPISDYVNDTKSVIENVPRLLAAMQFIATDDRSTAGTFELLCQFARTKQYILTRSIVSKISPSHWDLKLSSTAFSAFAMIQVKEDPLLQVPGFTENTVNRFCGSQGKKESVASLRELRALDRNAAAGALQKVLNGKGAVEKALDYLYSIPQFAVKEAQVHHEVEKTTGLSRGKLRLSLEFNRDNRGNKKGGGRFPGDSSFTLVVLLGSLKQRMLLAEESISVPQGSGTWTASKDLDFDWSSANADGGEGKGQMVMRLIWEEIRGFDSELIIHLN